MKKLLYLFLFLSFISVYACGSSEKSNDNAASDQNNQKTAVAPKTLAKTKPVTNNKVQQSNDAVSKEALESRLKSLGIPIYENAVFENIKKTKTGAMITYTLSDNSQEKVKQVHEFYSKVLDKIAAEKGWKKISMGYLVVYRTADKKIPIAFSNAVQLKTNKHLLQFEFEDLS